MPWTRIVSAAVLAPFALLAIAAGGYWYGLLLAIAGALMAWEWEGICHKRFSLAGAVLASMACLGAFFAASFPWTALAVVAFSAAAVMGRSVWLPMGALYIGLPIVALPIVRESGGATTTYWLFAVVWATDVGAYFFGRAIGGPKLASRISPNKTWAGLLGGMLCAVAVSLAFVWALDLRGGLLACFSACLAGVAQGGDLFESALKRRFNVKDSSGIIPGHGGVLDRVDGLVAVAPVVAAAVLSFGGGIELWR